MNAAAPGAAATPGISTPQVDDFSLALGGPLYRLYLRTSLARPSLEVVHRRMLVLPLLAWLPLLALALGAGQAVGGVALPLLADLELHARCFGALPLLLGAEVLVHRRLRVVVGEFVHRGLITPPDLSRFDQLLAQAVRWRNSKAAEAVLLVAAGTLGHWLWQTQLRPDLPTWYADTSSGAPLLTVPGHWYAFVSLPLLRFLLFRWYYRLGLWYRLLWQVSRLPLRLCAQHPDRAGGLGFLVRGMHAFTPLLLAHSVLVAGVIATRILHTGCSLAHFRVEITATLAALLLTVVVPPLFFAGHLLRARHDALRENGLAASRVPVGAGDGDARRGHLASVGAAIQQMRAVPFARGDLLQITASVASPIAPLLLTVFPLEEILRHVVDVVF